VFPVAPPRAATQQKPEPARPSSFDRLLRDLRLLEAKFVADARKGRGPSTDAVTLALQAISKFEEAFPDRAADIRRAMPWLARERARRAA
jgi:hypothetical protein